MCKPSLAIINLFGFVYSILVTYQLKIVSFKIKLMAKGWAWELVPYRSVGGLSTTGTARRYPWQPCEREPPLHAATTWHRHTDKRSVEKILTIPNTYLNSRIVRVGGLGAKIRNDLRNWNANDTQRSAENEAKACHKVCCKHLGVIPQVTYTNGGWPLTASARD